MRRFTHSLTHSLTRVLIGGLLVFVLLRGVVGVLADYLGPDRVRRQAVEVCRVVLLECMHVIFRGEDRGWKYHPVEDWVCSNEAKPWLAYPNVGPECTAYTAGAQYWERQYSIEERIITYPEARIEGELQGCERRNGWCVSLPELWLRGAEPVAGYEIVGIEGNRNGEGFFCEGGSCQLGLEEGENVFAYWALSSWGDSSRMGGLSVRVDTRPPQLDVRVSGVAGEAGWYVSQVSLEARGWDAEPGSGVETLMVEMDGGSTSIYDRSLVIGEGVHEVALWVRDRAGHENVVRREVKVDTVAPQVRGVLNGEQVNGWYVKRVDVQLIGEDGGSGLGRLEYAIDGGEWQEYSGPFWVGDGVHELRVRGVDVAGNVGDGESLRFRVDGRGPQVVLPEAWYIWEGVEVRVREGESGLSMVKVEIRDPQGRWPKVQWEYEGRGDSFVKELVWDRRFGDGSLAPIGEYEVTVKALDRAGNMGRAVGKVVIPPPQETPSPPVRTSLAEVEATATEVGLEWPVAKVTVTATPTRAMVVQRLSSLSQVEGEGSEVQRGGNSAAVLWGAAALGAVGAAMGVVLAGRRRRKEEEEAQQRAVRVGVEAKNAAEEARVERMRQALKVRNWLQGKAMLEAQLQEAEKAGASQEQIDALRQIGWTKGLGTALTATAVAIRLMVEKNRAQFENSHPPVSGGGKRLAFPVYRTDSGSFILADDEPPTFWDKLKRLLRQLRDAFWNWVKGKAAKPIPTAIPSVPPTISSIPTPTATPTLIPTLTPTMPPTPTLPPTLTPTLVPTFQPLPGGYARYSPYWYGKSYFDILANTNGWWHNYQGQPFGMNTVIAAVYNYEIASFGNDPLVREYFTEAFARRYWQSQIDYGPDGAFWYLGGRDMVRLRVLSNVPGIYETDYDFSQAFREAERIMTNTAWQKGITWTAPYDWGNPIQDKIDAIREKLPDFFEALLERRMGTSDTQILYLSPDSIKLTLSDGTTVNVPNFFIVTKGQSVVLCQNRSCVNP